MACRLSVIGVVFAALFAAGSARAQALEPSGVWLTQVGDAKVRVSKCGGGIPVLHRIAGGDYLFRVRTENCEQRGLIVGLCRCQHRITRIVGRSKRPERRPLGFAATGQQDDKRQKW